MSRNHEITTAVDGLIRIIVGFKDKKLSSQFICLALEKKLLELKLEFIIRGSADDDLLPPEGITPLSREIHNYIQINGVAENSEIFQKFLHVSQRTVRRSLSSLIKFGLILRIARGRQVFYEINKP